MDFTVRDLAAEKREAQKQAKLRAAIEREREAAAERKAEREVKNRFQVYENLAKLTLGRAGIPTAPAPPPTPPAPPAAGKA